MMKGQGETKGSNKKPHLEIIAGKDKGLPTLHCLAVAELEL